MPYTFFNDKPNANRDGEDIDAREIAEARGRLTGNVERFLLGGKAAFTLVNPAKGTKYRFKVRRGEGDFENSFSIYAFKSQEEGYKWLGCFKLLGDRQVPGAFFTTAKCKFDHSGSEFMAFEYVFNNRKNLPEKVELWHVGRCGVCNKKLDDPQSIAIGIGPVCLKKA